MNMLYSYASVRNADDSRYCKVAKEEASFLLLQDSPPQLKPRYGQKCAGMPLSRSPKNKSNVSFNDPFMALLHIGAISFILT